MDESQRKYNKQLIEHVKKLYDAAKPYQPTDLLKKCEQYYRGDFNGRDNIYNNYNIVRPIIETKTTLILDSEPTMNVEPEVFSFSSIDQIHEFSDIADILNDGLKHVKRINKFDLLKQNFVRRSEKTGISIAKVFFNDELSKGLGDVCFQEVSPLDFFPDPSSSKIDDCNYITVRVMYSAITLKKKYPKMIEDIDRLSRNQGQNQERMKNKSAPNSAVTTFQAGSNVQQVYNSEGFKNIDKVKDQIEVFECYLKDDSTFIKSHDDDSSENEFNEDQMFMYPNGRVIIYSGDDVIFEDKAIDYPFGFPFRIFNIIETDSIWGQGDIQPLMEIQDRINRAYWRIRDLVANYISCLLIDPRSGINKQNKLKNNFVFYGEYNSAGASPLFQLMTNNTLDQLEAMLKYIEVLKNDAKQISRINDTILSGERERGVTSGQMVEALNESPLTSIRASQRNFEVFLTEIGNMAIVLMQLYYNVPRMIRMSKGQQFAVIPNRSDEMSGIKLYESKTDENGQRLIEQIKEIKGDLSLGDYEVKVVSGSELPRSRSATAQITMELARDGFFGDINDIDVKEMVLERLDYSNYRAIVSQMRAKQEEAAKQPPPTPGSLVDKVALSFKDLPIFAQDYLLSQLGVPIPDQEPAYPQEIAS